MDTRELQRFGPDLRTLGAAADHFGQRKQHDRDRNQESEHQTEVVGEMAVVLAHVNTAGEARKARSIANPAARSGWTVAAGGGYHARPADFPAVTTT
jgi:hypothetical protein